MITFGVGVSTNRYVIQCSTTIGLDNKTGIPPSEAGPTGNCFPCFAPLPLTALLVPRHAERKSLPRGDDIHLTVIIWRETCSGSHSEVNIHASCLAVVLGGQHIVDF